MSESTEQQALLQWAEIYTNRFPELSLLHAIPNGGQRHISTAVRLKKEGVKAGVPDIFFPVSRWTFHGLYIEMKDRKSGTTSDTQKDWIKKLSNEGYAVHICHGWEAARDTILWYLNK